MVQNEKIGIWQDSIIMTGQKESSYSKAVMRIVHNIVSISDPQGDSPPNAQGRKEHTDIGLQMLPNICMSNLCT